MTPHTERARLALLHALANGAPEGYGAALIGGRGAGKSALAGAAAALAGRQLLAFACSLDSSAEALGNAVKGCAAAGMVLRLDDL